MKKLLAFSALLFLSACCSTTRIRSSDPDTGIYLNGEYIGTSGRATRTERWRSQGTGSRFARMAANREIMNFIGMNTPMEARSLAVTEYEDQHACEFNCEKSDSPAVDCTARKPGLVACESKTQLDAGRTLPMSPSIIMRSASCL